jgi:hypothetical protein|tara:strand:+ start:1548 stop:2000 length:453 start_codon:yes stop_codon:yes gene_type:complete
MFKTKQHAEGHPKQDLKLLRGYLAQFDRDIKEAAEKASQFKRLELEMEVDGTNNYLKEIPPRDFYDLLIQVMKDLNSTKRTIRVMEGKVVRVIEQTKTKKFKSRYKIYEWLLLVPFFVKFGWVKHGEISAGKRSALRERGRQHSEVRVRF